jgi:hypothetical protein
MNPSKCTINTSISDKQTIAATIGSTPEKESSPMTRCEGQRSKKEANAQIREKDNLQMIKFNRRRFGKVAAAPAVLAAAVESAQPRMLSEAGSVTVGSTTVQWPGKPATSALNIVFPNGHRLLWDTDNCRLFAWYDERGVALTAGPWNDLWYLTPEVIVYEFGKGVTSQVTASNDAWGTMGVSRPQFLGYTTTADSVTVTYRIPNQGSFSGTTTYQETFRAETRVIGGVAYNGFSLTATVDTGGTVPPGIGTVHVGLIPRLALNGSQDGMDGWRFDGDGGGIRQWRFADAIDNRYDSGKQTFAIVTHAQGTFVTYPRDIRQVNAGRPLLGIQAVDFSPPRNALQQLTAGPLVFLFGSQDAARPAPQRYLNARFAVTREQLQVIGFTSTMPYWFRPFDSAGPGRVNWSGYMSFWKNNYQPYSIRRLRLIAHIDCARSSTPGDPATITGTAPLFPELYLPNAVENLPAGDPYVQGTLQDFRDLNDAARALGVHLDYWTREWYEGKEDPTRSTVWSRVDRTWPGSILWKQHPDWAPQNPDGTLQPQPVMTPNLAHPDYQAFRRQWVHDGWFVHGVHGLFRDTGGFATGHQWYNGVAYHVAPVDVDFWVYVHSLGLYFLQENPVPLLLVEYNQAAPWAALYREWGAPMCFASFGPQGMVTSQLDWSNSQVDAATARRYHCVAAGVGCDPALQIQPAVQDAVRAEYARFASRMDRFGMPDRVELINLQPAPAPALSLLTAMTATDQPARIQVSNIFHLPDSGRVRIGNEVLWYGSTSAASEVGDRGEGWLQNIIRGYQGTPREAHAVGDPVVSLDDSQHWDYSDAYWVYGNGPDEVWARYSDGTVWQRGGSAPATLPSIANVQVTVSGTSATLVWTTDRPCVGWVEYDTFGTQEILTSQRPAEWWPAYLHRSAATALGTSHTVTLQDLQPGTIYHYRIVVRGPAQAVTPDATFTTPKQTAVTLQAPLVNK